MIRLLGLGFLAAVSALLTDGGVVVLKDAELWDKYVDPANNKVGMIEFYAPWCGHCQQFKPEYENIAAEMVEHDIRIAKVDITDYKLKERIDELEVTEYPTLFSLRNGELILYNDARDLPTIKNHLLDMRNPKWKKPAERVVELTDENFEEFVNGEEFTVVEFYAPWCGHCKKLLPEYEAAAADLNKDGIKLAKIDANKYTEIGQQYGVTGYPTLKIFRRGKDSDYNGPRERNGIVLYVLDQVSPPSTELLSKKEYKKILEKGTKKGAGLGLIAFFTNPEDELIVNYADAANDLREDFTFHHVNGENVAAFGGKNGHLRLSQAGHLQSKYEQKFLDFDLNGKSADEIKNWVIEHTLPLVGAVTPATSKFYEHQFPRCLTFYSVDFSHQYIKNTQLWREKVLKIAIEFVKRSENVIFAVADEDQNKALLEKFNLHESAEELNFGCIGADKLFYPMEEFDEWDHDEISDFVKSVLKGKAKAFIKSEKIPKKQGNVVKVVGKTFKQIVEDESKNVLIEFYAPWCGHCKSLAPIYEELGKEFKDDDSVVIAKMDSIANDITSPEFIVEGFPTIYFKPAFGQPIKYDKGREIADFITFIEENKYGAEKKDEL